MIPGSGRSPEKEMATRILAWRIPWTEKPGGLQSIWSERVGRDWVINFKGTARTKTVVSNTALHCKAPALLGGELLPCLSSGKSTMHWDILLKRTDE